MGRKDAEWQKMSEKNRAKFWTSETAPKGKGGLAKKIYFTYEDISRVTGRSIQTIRNNVAMGKLVPGDLKNLVKYVSRYLT